MDEGQKTALLKHVAAGHDLESACATLDIGLDEVRKEGKAFAKQVVEAARVGTSRLKARLLQGALDGNDLRIIGNILEEREQAERKTGGSGISTIKITVVEAKCPCCGKRHGNDAADRGNGTLDLDDVEPEPEPVAPIKKPAYVRKYRPWIREGGI